MIPIGALAAALALATVLDVFLGEVVGARGSALSQGCATGRPRTGQSPRGQSQPRSLSRPRKAPLALLISIDILGGVQDFLG